MSAAACLSTSADDQLALLGRLREDKRWANRAYRFDLKSGRYEPSVGPVPRIWRFDDASGVGENHEVEWHSESRQASLGGDLAELTRAEMLRVGARALQVWAEVERRRGYVAGRPRADERSLAELAAAACVTPRQCKAALARLRELGVVRSTWLRILDELPNGTRRWRTRTKHVASGYWSCRRGRLRVFMPAEALERWLATHRGPGRPTGAGFNYGLADACGRVDQVRETTEGDELIPVRKSYKEEDTNTASSQEVFSPIEKTGDDAAADRVGADGAPCGAGLIQDKSKTRTPSGQPSPAPTARPASKPKFAKLSEDKISPLLGEESAVELCLSAYRWAAAKQFGEKAKGARAFEFTDVALSRFYPRIAAGVAVLREEEIAPRAWCAWMAKLAKKQGRSDPPPALVVFSSGLIRKRLGWFRATSDESYGQRLVGDPPRDVLERLWRRRESMAQRNGVNSPHLRHEPWYAEMRAREIADGHLDPLDMLRPE